MRVLTRLAAASMVASVVMMPAALAQQPPPPAAAAAPTPADIKQEMEKIKKGRTLGIIPAVGTDDSAGDTVLRVDNTSQFPLIVLIVGPTIQRIDLGREDTQTLIVEPGAYEIAVTVVGRNLPPFYGTQRILRRMRYQHHFVIPVV